MATHPVKFFRNAEELAEQAIASVDAWALSRLDTQMDQLRARRDQVDKERRAIRDRQRVVNLRPLDMTHTFQDRLREICALCDHLGESGVRLVSIVGRGGMGKTALVSRVLADLEQGVLPVPGGAKEVALDGILYLSARITGLGLERICADVGKMLGEPVASTLAAHWADQDIPLVAKVEYLLETMQEGLYLILLDNLEDYLTEDGDITEEGLRFFIERCLTQPSGARLVITSRKEVKIAAAALHSARCIPLREGLSEDDAIALLRDLDPQGMLGLRGALEEDLRRAARHTQGIPRALEILAGILHEDPTTSLASLLADEATLGAEIVERLVAEGYRRLGGEEQRVMEALAVFDGPVGATAIAYLLHPWFRGLNVRACLRHLIRSYFVSVNRATDEYSLHPLDRDHAYRQLPADDESDTYSRRNLELRAADFYLNIRKPESEWHSIDDLAPQLAEFEHRIRAGDYDGACWVLQPIDFEYLYLWGHFVRLGELQHKILEHLTAPSLRAYNLDGLGRTFHALGQLERATNLFHEALIIVREVGDRTRESQYLSNLGRAYHASGQFEQAIECHEQSVIIARQIGARREEGRYLCQLGFSYRYLGKLEKSIEAHHQSLTIAREIGDRVEEGRNLGNLGSAYREGAQPERAIAFYEQALSIAREMGDRWEEDTQLGRLGYIFYDLGRSDQAIAFEQEALAIAREIGDRGGEGRHIDDLGDIYHSLGQLDQVIAFREESLRIAREIGDHHLESQGLQNLGIIHRDKGRSEQALELFQEALKVARKIGDRPAEIINLRNLGLVFGDLGRIQQSISFHQEALSIAQEMGLSREEGFCLLELGKALLVADDLPAARARCLEALALDMPGTSFQAGLILGIVLLRQHDPTAQETFTDAIARCHILLGRTPDLFQPRYAMAAALVGSVVCDPRWLQESERAELLTPALSEYRRAIKTCAAPGVVHDAICTLEMIQMADVKGLEPVFELLEAA